MRPSPQMADEAETLIEEQGAYGSPDCEPADSLDGSGRFNFDCTGLDGQGSGERIKLGVTVNGSLSGRPDLGPVIAYSCDPVNAKGEDLPRTC
jgi:hypothetical protein